MVRFATLEWPGLICCDWKGFSIDYRGIRIALGLMCSTPNNSLRVLSGIAPLGERFLYLNFRYLVAVFYCFDHPLKRRLETLGELNLRRCIAGCSDVLPLNVVPSESFTRHDLPALLAANFVGDQMEAALCRVHASVYSVVAPRELLTVTARYATSMIFYTDGSLIDGCAEFAFHRTGEGGFGYKISSPAGAFTAELTALFVTLQHIEEVIQPPERCLILTDSLSSVRTLMSREISYRTHPLVYERKQMCSDLLEGVAVEIMCIRLTWGSRVTGLWTSRRH
jgi:hypothetical protein